MRGLGFASILPRVVDRRAPSAVSGGLITHDGGGQPAMAEAATGAVRVEKVRGRSALTRCFARYPLKLIAPSKVGPASCDAVWLYALTYGGGIVSVSPRPSPFRFSLHFPLRHRWHLRFRCGCCIV
jgi:hypothetical protein